MNLDLSGKVNSSIDNTTSICNWQIEEDLFTLQLDKWKIYKRIEVKSIFVKLNAYLQKVHNVPCQLIEDSRLTIYLHNKEFKRVILGLSKSQYYEAKYTNIFKHINLLITNLSLTLPGQIKLTITFNSETAELIII